MSLNIQTANGLLEIGGNVTKEKVISALGYEPAEKEVGTTVGSHTQNADIHITAAEREAWNKDIENLEVHISDKTLHITSEERETWNNKSDFSGAYVDLLDAPSITETESGNMVIADEGGNIIMQVDADGLETTNVSANTLSLNGEDIGTKIDEHISNEYVHVTLAEKESWSNKSGFSGDYNDLTNKPNIVDDGSGEIIYTDNDGYIIARINDGGLETTNITAKSAVINGVDIEVKLDEHKEDIDEVDRTLSSHVSNSVSHITADERTLWNAKSDFSGDYSDLTNAPNIKEDNSGEVVYADEAGNVILKIGETGLETTQVIANNVIAGGINVGEKLSNLDSSLSTYETKEDANSKLAEAKEYADNAAAQRTQVQLIIWGDDD